MSAEDASRNATNAQALLTEAVKAAEDIKNMVYNSPGNAGIEGILTQISDKVKEI
jgi:hypothetical protein